MTYKVLKSLVYGGIAYTEGQEVDIIEKSVAENCLKRELIAEITDTETDNTEVTVETDSAEITENNEDNEDATGEEDRTDKTEEVVSSETTEEQTKTNKRNRK
jgi:GTP-binding protein lepA